jgi:transcriptional regulator with XRE-family HTH domain
MKKLAKVRKLRGMSQTALAAALRTSQANVSKWEKGHTTPRPNTLTRISQALCCKESELI